MPHDTDADGSAEFLALRRAEVAVLQEQEARQKRESIRNLKATVASVLVSALAIAASVWLSVQQLEDAHSQDLRAQQQANVEQQRANQEDAERTRAELQQNYNAMVAELGSSSPAVEVNALRRLVQFVEDRDGVNYAPRSCDQWFAAGNLAQTLEEYIAHSGRDQRLRAAQQLRQLTDARTLPAPTASQGECLGGGHDVLLSNVNLAEAGLDDWTLPARTHFGIYHVDLTGADLTGLDLSGVAYPASFQNSNLTCAKLGKAKLGDTDLEGATLAGADLRGADLSKVTRVASASVFVGTQVDAATRLPRIDNTRLTAADIATAPGVAPRC